jgi:hypothetical protein
MKFAVLGTLRLSILEKTAGRRYRPSLPAIFVVAFLLPFLAGCLSPVSPPGAASPGTKTTQTSLPPTLTLTPSPLPTETVPPTSTPEPAGCLQPPEDYTQVEVNGETLNRRTLAMLEHAQNLYGGEINLPGYAITQGSYTDAVSASFGTHAGGGAVDLSVMREETYTVLWDDIPSVLSALRATGFAAWLRDYGELHPDSPIHIHAIAIGDRELSEAARDQLTGTAGYFRGFNGLPVEQYGGPTPDRYGPPILCQWMIDLGYQDLR